MAVLLRAAIAPRCGQAAWVKGEECFQTGWLQSSLSGETVALVWYRVRISYRPRVSLKSSGQARDKLLL